MKRYFSRYHLAKLICLLMVAGILYLSRGLTAFAVEDNRPDSVTESVVTDTPYRDSNLTGTESERTNVDPPGASESAEDLAELINKLILKLFCLWHQTYSWMTALYFFFICVKYGIFF